MHVYIQVAFACILFLRLTRTLHLHRDRQFSILFGSIFCIWVKFWFKLVDLHKIGLLFDDKLTHNIHMLIEGMWGKDTQTLAQWVYLSQVISNSILFWLDRQQTSIDFVSVIFFFGEFTFDVEITQRIWAGKCMDVCVMLCLWSIQGPSELHVKAYFRTFIQWSNNHHLPVPVREHRK